MKEHHYHLNVDWTGNTGSGTETYRSYERSHTIYGVGRPEIAGSSDPAFRGDGSKYSPEDLLVASLSACHMLWFLHLCTEAGIVVVDYRDKAEGVMIETADGGGRFKEVILRPVIRIAGDAFDVSRIDAVHEKAHRLCFIANSCNFPVSHAPEYIFGAG